MRLLWDARVVAPQARHGIARHALGLLREAAGRPGRHDFLVLVKDQASREWLAETLPPRPGLAYLVGGGRPYHKDEQVALPLILARHRVDLYYSPTYLPPLLSPAPLAFTIHDLIQLDFPVRLRLSQRLAWRVIIRPAARRARAVLTVSAASAQAIVARLRVDPGRVHVVGNGLEPAFVRRPPEEARAAAARLGLAPPYLIGVGNSFPHKNLIAAAEAVHDLARRGWPGQLLLVGAKHLTLPPGPGRIVISPPLADEDQAALYSGAAAAVCPSLAEGFGLPPLEALACGCPVVAFDLPVYRETLGRSGVTYLSRLTPAALAEALAGLLADPGRALAQAAVGAEAAARFTWAKAAERLLAVFDRLAAEIKGPRRDR